MTSVQVQDYAQRASYSGALGLEGLAGVGASGTYAGNLYRNLKTVVGFPSGCAPIEWVLIPTRVARETPHPVMMPHKFLQEVFRHRPDIWQQRFIGQSGAAFEFW